MRIVFFDIESTNLQANFGSVLCLGWKVYGQKAVHVPSIKDHNGVCECCSRINNVANDKSLLKEMVKALSDADVWVTWYGSRFDVPFINSRLAFHKLPPLPYMPHIDLWRPARNHYKLHSNRLASVPAFLELPDEKTPLTGPDWMGARTGNQKGLKYVVKHCKQDVLVLEQAYERMLPLIKSHPSRRLADGRPDTCPRCGHDVLHRKGTYVTATRRYQRWQCQGCGGFMKDSKPTDIDHTMTL